MTIDRATLQVLVLYTVEKPVFKKIFRYGIKQKKLNVELFHKHKNQGSVEVDFGIKHRQRLFVMRLKYIMRSVYCLCEIF